MKKGLRIAAFLLILVAIFGCAGNGSRVKVPILKGEQLLDHKGTALGYNPPKWFEAAYLGSYRDLEKMPEYKNLTIFIAKAEAQNLPAAELLASRMDAQTQIAAYLSTRVQDAFKGANVADADSRNFGSYGERFVQSVGEADFTGFRMESDWWTHVQTFTPQNQPDKQIYRVLQVWSIEDEMLKKQFDIILKAAMGSEPKTVEQQRAVDLVQNTVSKDFFGGR
ncbi:MAG: hypothetical protein WAX33_09655 [Rectinemataceae bacterium]